MSELPSGWVSTLLSEVASVEMGQSPDSRSYNDRGEGLPFFQGKAEFGKLYPTVRKWCSEPNKTADAGDILLSVRAPVGPTNLATEKSCIGRGLAGIKAREPVDQTYLLHYFRNIEEWLSQQGTGTTFTAISGGFIRTLPIPIAPLNEQKRIAARLDALLERVDACRARLERVPLLLKRFRQAVLAAATSGQLTEDWRETHPHSEWQAKLLGELITEPKNDYSAKPVDYQTPYKVLTLTATTSGKFDPRYFKYFDQEISTSSSLWLQPGDILIQRGNTIEYVGVPAIYNGAPNQFVYPDLMIKFRAKELVVTEFLYFALSDKRARNFLRQNATGTAGNMPKINQKVLLNVPINLPSLSEQTEIVRRVETLFAYADRLEARYQQARGEVERLTPALLAKAFRGELVPQDPNDEPAAALLERLQSARANNANAPQAKPGTRRKQAAAATPLFDEP